MLTVKYYNDGKGKWQSHEVCLEDTKSYYPDANVDSLNPLDIVGYGASKEEAYDDFIKKFEYVMDNLKAFEATLLYLI